MQATVSSYLQPRPTLQTNHDEEKPMTNRQAVPTAKRPMTAVPTGRTPSLPALEAKLQQLEASDLRSASHGTSTGGHFSLRPRRRHWFCCKVLFQVSGATFPSLSECCYFNAFFHLPQSETTPQHTPRNNQQVQPTSNHMIRLFDQTTHCVLSSFGRYGFPTTSRYVTVRVYMKLVTRATTSRSILLTF